MATHNDFYAKAVQAYDEADQLLADETATQEAIDAKLEEAKGYEAKAEQAKAIADRKAAIHVPQRRTLPTNDPAPVQDREPVEKPEPEGEGFSAKAAYIMRFGADEDTLVKGVLTDMHGPGYAQKRFDQSKAFNTYLRVGDKGLDYQQVKLLREPIATPAEVKALMELGMEVPEMKATMVEGIGSLGGYVVPGDFSTNVVQRLPGMTAMRGRATGIQTSRDMVSLPVDKGGTDQYTAAVRETWISETPSSTAADSNLTFSMKDVQVHTAMTGVPISKNLIEDAAFDIIGHLTRKLSEAAAINEDNAFVVGDGVGKPQGILPGSTNANGLSYVAGGHATLLNDFTKLIAMTFDIPSQYLPGSVWLGNRSTFLAIAQLVDGNTQPYWRQTIGDNVTGLNRNLLGYPVVMQEGMPDIAANAFPLVFGNLAAYTIVDRLGITVERYDDATTASTNSVKYVMRRRLGGQLLEPYRLTTLKIATS